MSSQKRYEYHLVDGGVAQRIVNRPANVKRWRYAKATKSLIATIEAAPPSFQWREGPAMTPDLLAESVLMYKHGVATRSKNDLGPLVPTNLASQLADRLALKA